jgi:hypothetical protein
MKWKMSFLALVVLSLLFFSYENRNILLAHEAHNPLVLATM